MCGISGIVHSENIGRNLFNSIRNLEYRGYDSSGMALLLQGAIDLRKNVGGIDEVNSLEKLDQMQGSIGIAHTRWATHGAKTDTNSHPHIFSDGLLSLVHSKLFISLVHNQLNKFHLLSSLYYFVHRIRIIFLL